MEFMLYEWGLLTHMTHSHRERRIWPSRGKYPKKNPTWTMHFLPQFGLVELVGFWCLYVGWFQFWFPKAKRKIR